MRFVGLDLVDAWSALYSMHMEETGLGCTVHMGNSKHDGNHEEEFWAGRPHLQLSASRYNEHGIKERKKKSFDTTIASSANNQRSCAFEHPLITTTTLLPSL